MIQIISFRGYLPPLKVKKIILYVSWTVSCPRHQEKPLVNALKHTLQKYHKAPSIELNLKETNRMLIKAVNK